MPFARIYFYREKEEGLVPFLDWFKTLQRKARMKCQRQLILLQDLGYELRRPHGDYLRDDIYELRVRVGALIIDYSIFFMMGMRPS
jgi:hypothetical protein